MVTSSRRCKHCNKAGAYSFNNMCQGCWNKQIEINVMLVAKEINERTKKRISF